MHPPLILLAFVLVGLAIVALCFLWWIWKPQVTRPTAIGYTADYKPRVEPPTFTATDPEDRLGVGLDWIGEDPPTWKWSVRQIVS